MFNACFAMTLKFRLLFTGFHSSGETYTIRMVEDITKVFLDLVVEWCPADSIFSFVDGAAWPDLLDVSSC